MHASYVKGNDQHISHGTVERVYLHPPLKPFGPTRTGSERRCATRLGLGDGHSCRHTLDTLELIHLLLISFHRQCVWSETRRERQTEKNRAPMVFHFLVATIWAIIPDDNDNDEWFNVQH